jgi:hypothetical protein
MMHHSIGEISITQVIEQRGASFAPESLFPGWDPAILQQHRTLMVPACFDEREGRLISSIHRWVLRTRHHTILIDSCAGNHKNRPSVPRFHQLNRPLSMEYKTARRSLGADVSQREVPVLQG